jgi:hypothetical protein
MSREMLAAAVLVWLVGAVVGWCAGWAARTDQNRAWHHGLRHQLEGTRVELDQLRAQLADTLDELECAQADHEQPTPRPSGHRCGFCRGCR